MTTRGIIGVVDPAGEWSGFEIHDGAHPEGAGAELLKQLRTHGLDACCDRIRRGHLFSEEREHAELETHASPDDLLWAYFVDPTLRVVRVFHGAKTHPTRGDALWAYLVDPKTRVPGVSHEGALASATVPRLFGTWVEVAVHAIGPDEPSAT